MKKTIIATFAMLAVLGCADKKTQQLTLLDSVIKMHDKVMGEEVQLMKNKMQLEALSKQGNFSGKDTAKLLVSKLVLADSLMDNWMHKFNPDLADESGDKAVAYLSDQKKQIMAIDSQVTVTVAESNKYLNKNKTK
jgi:hypothetical protein